MQNTLLIKSKRTALVRYLPKVPRAIVSRFVERIKSELQYIRSWRGIEKKDRGELPESYSDIRHAEKQHTSQHVLTMSIVALAAKLAKIDGPITDKELERFPSILGLENEEVWKMRQLFLQARQDPVDAEHYALRLTRLYITNPATLHDIFDTFICFAGCDAPINGKEVVFLHKIARIFGMSEEQFVTVLRCHTMPSSPDPFEILGVSRKDSYADVRKAYFTVVKHCHPDALVSQDVTEEFKPILKERFALATQAYKAICKKRKWKG